jgi:AcrR family transcriptional regulator
MPPTKRRRPGRPRKDEPTLDKDAIVACALRIVRTDGLEGLVMHRIADELGVTPMALYNHIDNKKALLYDMVGAVWTEVQNDIPDDISDVIEFMVASACSIRRIWIENVELVGLSMAVAPVEETLFTTSLVEAKVLEMAGFPDVGLAATATMNYVLGSVATWANRHVASRYFERDPEQILADAQRLLDEQGATDDHRAVLLSRFDDASEQHFEAGLRALIDGLLRGP